MKKVLIVCIYLLECVLKKLGIFMRIVLFWLLCGIALVAQTYSDSALSAYGEVKYKDFKHFDYVNPNAPKGGHIKQYALGSFDSFYDFLLLNL